MLPRVGEHVREHRLVATLVESLLGHEVLREFEPLFAWGKAMLLDTSYQAHPGAQKPPTLAELRAALIAHYPQVGPIFA